MVKLKPNTVTLPELIQRFLASHRRLNRSPNSLEYYCIVLGNSQWYAKTNKWPEELEAITRGHLREFLDYVASESFPGQGPDAAPASRPPRPPSTTTARW